MSQQMTPLEKAQQKIREEKDKIQQLIELYEETYMKADEELQKQLDNLILPAKRRNFFTELVSGQNEILRQTREETWQQFLQMAGEKPDEEASINEEAVTISEVVNSTSLQTNKPKAYQLLSSVIGNFPVELMLKHADLEKEVKDLLLEIIQDV